jgi:hypothetical protein
MKLVIGIPTVPRPRDYLSGTIDSIVAGIAPEAWPRVEIVVFNASVPPERHRAARALAARHPDLARSGRLTIIEDRARDDVSPSPPSRDAWRRKLILDFVHLARACAVRGDHYLHVEDDVLAAAGFHADLERWFDDHFAARRDWAFLALFSTYRLRDREEIPARDFFSACALLFRSADALAFAAYAEARSRGDRALDLLMRDWLAGEGRGVFVRSPALFQHVGVFSSFSSELRPFQAASYPERRMRALARGARELLEVARERPRDLVPLLRWRVAVIAPPVRSAWTRIRRALGRAARDD